MKRSTRILWLFLLALLVGCVGSGKDSQQADQMVAPPLSSRLEYAGVWKVEKVEDLAFELSSSPLYRVEDPYYIAPSLVGNEVSFTVHPSFSAKYIPLKAYLTAKYPNPPKDLKVDGRSVPVLMVRDGATFAMDYLILGTDCLCFVAESRMYYLRRVDRKISKEKLQAFQQAHEDTQQTGTSGMPAEDISILVGVKEPLEPDEFGLTTYAYYTYLIRKENVDSRLRVYAVRDLLVPMPDDFWILSQANSSSQTADGKPISTISAHPLSVKDADNTNRLYDFQRRSVTYVHENLVSFDKVGNGPEANRTYEIYPLTKLNGSSFSVHDVAGDTGEEAIREQLKTQLTFIAPNLQLENVRHDPSNIGIERTPTRWGFFTSLEVNQGATTHYSRVALDFVPTLENFSSDPLQMDIEHVLSKNQLTANAFTTPRKEYILIREDDEILLYGMKSGTMVDLPALRIQLRQGSRIVMMEEAYGTTALNWEKVIHQQPQVQPEVIFGRE